MEAEVSLCVNVGMHLRISLPTWEPGRHLPIRWIEEITTATMNLGTVDGRQRLNRIKTDVRLRRDVKGVIISTPKKGYWIDGVRVPGTTTILGRFKESGGLLQWAFRQGQSGVSSLYEKRDEAADIGTRAHNLIERRVNGEDLDTILKSEESEGAINAFEMYLKWERQTKLNLLSKYQEIQLVSPTYLFGGTPDAIGEIDGEVLLIDWKTSNGVYSDYLIQLAAYQHLVNDGYVMTTGQSVGLKVGKGAHLLRFSKDQGDFGHHYYGNLDDAWDQFKLFRQAYDIDKKLAARTK